MPIPASAFSATISGLTQLTQRGLTPYVVLGFFPAGVYSGTKNVTPYPYGPDANDWNNWNTTILENWGTLVQAFFQALHQTFGDDIKNWWFEVWNEPDNPNLWVPDTGNSSLPACCQLYQHTVQAIADAGLPSSAPVRVGGPARSNLAPCRQPGQLGRAPQRGARHLRPKFAVLPR